MGRGGVIALMLALAVLPLSAASQTLPDEVRSANVTAAEYNADQGLIRILQRERSDEARRALARLFAQRSEAALGRHDNLLAARYALAGWRLAPALAEEFRRPLSLALHGSQVTLALDGYNARPKDLVIAPDGSFATATYEDGAVRSWDLRTGATRFALNSALEFGESFVSPDGSRIARLASLDHWENGVLLLDADGRRIAQLTQEGSISAVTFSPDSRRLLTQDDDGGLKTWSAVDGAPIAAWTAQGRSSPGDAAFSADGALVLTSALQEPPTIWNASTGARVRLLGPTETCCFGRFVFSPDGTKIALTADGIALYRAASNEVLWNADVYGVTAPLVFSRDGALLAAGFRDGRIRVFRVADGTQVATFGAHDGSITSISLSPDARRLVSTSYDHTIRVWSVETGREVTRFGLNDDRFMLCAFAPNGDRVLTISPGAAWLWQPERARYVDPGERGGGDGKVRGVSWRTNRLLIARSRGPLSIVDIATGAQVASSAIPWGDLTPILQVFPNEAMFFDSDAMGHTQFWSVESGEQLAQLAVNVWRVDPTGRLALVRNSNGGLTLWDWRAGRAVQRLEGVKNAEGASAFTDDGARVAMGGDEEPLRVWDVASGDVVAELQGRGIAMCQLQFYAGGRFLFGRECYDGDVWVWDMQSRQPVFSYRAKVGEFGGIYAAAVSPDGNRFATSSDDEIVRIWNARSFEIERATTTRQSAGLTAQFSADGSRLIIGGRDGYTRVWDVGSGRELAAIRSPREDAWDDGEPEAVESYLSPEGGRVLSIVYGDQYQITDISRLTLPMQQLAAAACNELLRGTRAQFTALEQQRDPLIRDVWLARRRVSVCAI